MATNFTHGYNLGKGGGAANALHMGQGLNTANSQFPLPGQGGRAPTGPNPATSNTMYKQAGAAAAGAAFGWLQGMSGIGQHQLDASTNNAAIAQQKLDMYRSMAAAVSSNTNEAANSAFGTGAVHDLNMSLVGQADTQAAHYTRLQRYNVLVAKANERNQKIAAFINAVSSAAAGFAAAGGGG